MRKEQSRRHVDHYWSLLRGKEPRPGPFDWKTRRGLLFQSMKNRYLAATYEAVVHRILGRGWVVGLRWVVWIRFWVPRWIQSLGPIWGLGLRVGWWGF